MSHFHSYLHTKDMDMSSKRAGRGHEVPSPAPPFPMIPRSLKHVISTLPTSQFTLGHYTGTKLNGAMSDDQYMRFKRDAGDLNISARS